MNKEKIIKVLFVLMLIVIPTNLIISRFIIELTLAEMMIGVFIITVNLFYFKNIYIVIKKHKNFLILSVLFIFTLMISSVLSIVPRFSLIKWIEFYFTGLLLGITFLLLLENGLSKKYFLKTIMRVGMFYAVMGIIEALFRNDILWLLKAVRIPPSIKYDYPKIAGIFEWHTVFGSVMAFNGVISFILFTKKKIAKREFIVSEVFFFIGIILSASRNAIFTVVLGVILIVLLNKKFIRNIKKRFLILYTIIFLIGIYGMIQFYPPTRKTFNRFSNLLTGKKEVIDRLNSSSSGRITIIKISIRTFIKHPIVGIGVRVFPYYSKIFLHTHNIFLQFLVEGGLVGFIFFMLLLICIIRRSIKLKFNYELILLIIFLFNQSFGYFVGHIYYFVFYMWLIFVLNIYKYEK